jgi:DNA repair photolyase
MYKINLIQARSILTKSGLPVSDYVVNPYVGCHFGCKYCYASFIGRWRHPSEKWGEFVDVKINAAEVFKKELEKKKSKNFGSIFFGSVTDPYQGLEAKYKITRQCLKVIADFNCRGSVSLLTKSPLVLRDLDVFKKIKQMSVGLTVTSTDDPISKYLETYAPAANERIRALKKLKDAGIETYAFVGPLLPNFVLQKENLEKLFQKLAEIKVDEIWVEHINLSSYIKERLFAYLKKDYPQELKKFQEAENNQYKKRLEKIILALIKKYQLKLACQKILSHKK